MQPATRRRPVATKQSSASRSARTRGSVVQKGMQLARRHKPDYQIVLYMGLLMLLGLIIMYAIGPQRAQVLNVSYGTDFYTSTYFFIKQGASLLLALGAFVAMALIPLSFIQKNAVKLLIAGIAACALLFITGNLLAIDAIAKCELGACRWFNLGPLGSFQPAEILKFGLLLFGAGFLGMRAKQGLINDRDKTLLPLGIIVGIAMLFVIILQQDLGTGISIAAIVASMLVVANMNKKVGLTLLIGAFIMGCLFIVSAEHRRERFVTYLEGDSTAQISDEGYHIANAKIAIGTGGLLGVGIGNSVQATGYLPEAINDSVFAIMGETFGFVGLVAILGLFTGLLLRLLRVLDHVGDMSLKLIVAGVFGWLAAHVILNVAAMIGVFPLTGITLPLLSFGGTSMIFIAAALGLVFQLSRYTSHGYNQKETVNENSSSRRRVGRTRYASRRSPSRT